MPELVGLTSGAEAGRGCDHGQHCDEPAQRGSEHFDAGEVGDGRSGQTCRADHVREARGSRVLERALTEDRLNQLEVRQTREAVPTAEGQPDDKLHCEQRKQQPPAGKDREGREHSYDDLVETRRPRVDDIEVAVWICEP